MSFNYGSVHGTTLQSVEERPHYGLSHQPITIPGKPKGWDDAFTEYVNLDFAASDNSRF